MTASRVEHPKQKTNVAVISSPCPSCTLAHARCLTRGAATERIFLLIHNLRIFHPNNLKYGRQDRKKIYGSDDLTLTQTSVTQCRYD